MQSNVQATENNYSNVVMVDGWRDVPDINQNTIAIYDLDDTLITPIGVEDIADIPGEIMDKNICAIGSDLWFRDCYHRRKNETSSHDDAMDHTISIFNAVQQFSIVKPVEAEAITHFDKVIKREGDFLGVTARSDCLAEKTYVNLQKHGFDFNHEGVPSDCSFKVDGINVKFSNNILYCDGEDKGRCLEEFRKTKYGQCLFDRNKSIFFIDDSIRNCKHVVDAAKRMDIACQAVHYTYVKSNYSYTLSDPDKSREKYFEGRGPAVRHACSISGMFARKRVMIGLAAFGLAAAGAWVCQA